MILDSANQVLKARVEWEREGGKDEGEHGEGAKVP